MSHVLARIVSSTFGGPKIPTLHNLANAIAYQAHRSMSTIKATPAQVKELREKTGSPMMDCKNALEASAGDVEKAIEWLRKKGMASAAKKESRKSADGLVVTLLDNSGLRGSVVELNSETDFVARNPIFQKLAVDLCKLHLTCHGQDFAGFKTAKLASGPKSTGAVSVEDAVKEMVATVGENCQLRRAAGLSVTKGGVFRYIHNALGDDMGKLGVLVALESTTTKTDALKALGTELAMHVAAGNPLFATVEEIPAAAADKEKAIFMEQAASTGKAANLLEKMVQGRIKKWHDEVVLLEQECLVGEPKRKVKKILADAQATLGAPVALKGFLRFKCGDAAAAAAAAN